MKHPVLASIAVVASLSLGLGSAVAGPSSSSLDARACMKKHHVTKVHRGYAHAPRWQAVEVCDCVVLPREYVLALNGLPAFPKSTPWFAR